MPDCERTPAPGNLEPDVYARIRRQVESLSPAKRAVAEYLLTRVEDAAFWPAARLARAVGVSESVVVRLAADLGYQGYPHLQQELQEVVRQRLGAAGRAGRPGEGSGHTPVERAFRSHWRLLDETLRANPPDAFLAAATALLGARRIVTVGMRMAYPVAAALGFNLHMFLGNVTVLTAGADTLEDSLRHYGPGDVAVVCDFRPYNPMTVPVAGALRGRGVTLITITDSPLAPVAEGAAAIFQTATEGDFSSHRSLVGPMAVADALVALVCDQGGQRCENSVQETISLRLQFHPKTHKR